MSKLETKPEALPPKHCLLSEFDTPVFRWLGIARSNNAGWYMALACFVWAALTILFGHLVGANACGLELQATDGTVTASQQLIWGWLVQVNAGPFYLLVAPVLLVITHRFLLACGQALGQLAASGRLKPVKENGVTWDAEMARRNRVCVIALWTLPLFLFICFYVQLSSINRGLIKYPTAKPQHLFPHFGTKTNWAEIGYSQSIAFENWVRDFNALKSTNSLKGTDLKLAILADRGWLPGLEQKLFNELDRRNATGTSSLEGYFDFKDGNPVALHLKNAWVKTNLMIEAMVLRSTNDSILQWKQFTENKHPHPKFFVFCYKLFIVLEQIQIAAFFTFGIWLTFKIVFWLFQIYRMLPKGEDVDQPVEPNTLCWLGRELLGRRWYVSWLFVALGLSFFGKWPVIAWLLTLVVALIVWMVWWIGNWFKAGDKRNAQRCELKLEPILSDPSGRYGLGALFRPYNLLVLTAAVGASYIAFTLPFGVHLKDITSPDGAGSGATAVGHLIVITIVFSAIVCGPLWFFPKRLSEWAKKERLNDLYGELAKVEDKKALLEEEAKILEQTTWPSGDNYFKVTLAIILAILLLPLGSALNFLPGEAVTATQLPQVIREKCREIVADWYQLQPVETNAPPTTNSVVKPDAKESNKTSGRKQ